MEVAADLAVVREALVALGDLAPHVRVVAGRDSGANAAQRPGDGDKEGCVAADARLAGVLGGAGGNASQDLPDAAIERAAPDPAPILQLGLGFWASKTLLSAVELGVFTELAHEPLDAETLRVRLGLHPRATLDFLDALVALGILGRDERGYVDTSQTAMFLDRESPAYIGGLLEMANDRLYPFWASP